jgi:N6-L-threonylcarbamoyladenine synthase
MQILNIYILAIETSCDDTSCAVLNGDRLISQITATQKIHEQYGGVVPELASRDHQKNILPVVDLALKKAGILLSDLSAIAITRGPGLMGSLLVGLSFAKSLSIALQIPLIEVNHMQAHVLAHFIKDNDNKPSPPFPFICLTLSGGHTQLIKVNSYFDFDLIGETIDDAIGEAFDKAAKILGLSYPGGPIIDTLAKKGNKTRFKFSNSKISGYNYSFSGIKTSFLYFIQNESKKNPLFIKQNIEDICASYQSHLITTVLLNAKRLLVETGIKHFAIAGGVSSNSELRQQVGLLNDELDIETYILNNEYCTDNAAMIGITGYYKFINKQFSDLGITPLARMNL